MRLSDVDLEQLLCAPLQEDETGRAFAKVLSPYLRRIGENVKNVLLLPNVQNLSSEVLDLLARELHIPWYDCGTMVDIKRDVVAQSDKVNMRLGTPYAVEQVAISYFGTAVVEEWWEYGADPYHFRVRTGSIAAATTHREAFFAMVEATKNERSVFDGVQIDHSTPTAQIIVAFCLTSAVNMTIPMGGTT